ncbi:MAG TPA: hypothetical protein PKL68_03220 [Actinomycetota bacterium]|nr:hypothetical protein [Actinomycetota bacterium]HNO14795.1 hypothetical protein [Actinomycetota bacterium]
MGIHVMRFEKSLSAVATASAVVASLALGASPAAAAPPDYPLTGAIESVDVSVAPDGTFAYVADHDQQVLRVDTATNAVTDDLHYMSGRWVEAVAVSPDNTYVYAAHYVTPAMNGVVRRIDAATNTFVGSDIAVGNFPSDVVFAPGGDFALVVNGGGRHRLADRDGLRYGDRDDRPWRQLLPLQRRDLAGRHIRVREQHQPRLGLPH